MAYWGYHAMFDCSHCNKYSITSPQVLEDWVKELVERIDMVAFGSPQIVHFGHNEVHLEGWTVIQLIETSNIVAHFNDHTCEAYIDVFSCKPFDIEQAKQVIQEYFSPSNIRTNYITRQADK